MEVNLKDRHFGIGTVVSWSETLGHLTVFTMKLQIIMLSEFKVLLQSISIGIYLLYVHGSVIACILNGSCEGLMDKYVSVESSHVMQNLFCTSLILMKYLLPVALLPCL